MLLIFQREKFCLLYLNNVKTFFEMIFMGGKGEMSMEEIEEMNQTRYVVSRVFAEKNTIANIIQAKVLYENSQIVPLHSNGKKEYNKGGNSIQ